MHWAARAPTSAAADGAAAFFPAKHKKTASSPQPPCPASAAVHVDATVRTLRVTNSATGELLAVSAPLGGGGGSSVVSAETSNQNALVAGCAQL